MNQTSTAMQEVTRNEFNQLVKQVADLVKVLNGNGKIGLSGKVEIIWRSYIGLISLLSAGLGSLMTFVIMKSING